MDLFSRSLLFTLEQTPLQVAFLCGVGNAGAACKYIVSQRLPPATFALVVTLCTDR